MREILRFQPLYQERIWGGNAFASAFDRKIPADRPIGESWEIVDRPEAQSVVRGGTHNGVKLRNLIKKHNLLHVFTLLKKIPDRVNLRSSWSSAIGKLRQSQ